MNPGIRVLVIACAAALAAGCGGRKAVVDDLPAAADGGATSGAAVGRFDSTDGAAGQPFGGAGAEGAAVDAVGGSALTIYFDFDSTSIDPRDDARLEAIARRLSADAGATVRIEGHADERGSAEYNVALGERRAATVRRALVLRGARDSQISTVSYGEERPAVSGSGEPSWAQNRRAEIAFAASR